MEENYDKKQNYRFQAKEDFAFFNSTEDGANFRNLLKSIYYSITSWNLDFLEKTPNSVFFLEFFIFSFSIIFLFFLYNPLLYAYFFKYLF